MCRKSWSIALQYLLLVARDRMALVWLIFLPIIWTAMVAGISGSGGATGSGTTALAVVMNDSSPAANALVALLREEPDLKIETATDSTQVRGNISSGNLASALLIPEGFGRLLAEGQTATVFVLQSPRSTAYFLGEQINQAAKRLSADAYAAWFATNQVEVRKVLSPEEKGRLWLRYLERAGETWAAPKVSVRFEVLTKSAVETQGPQGANQASPGFAAMFILMGVLFGASSLVDERQDRTLARLLTTPLTRFALLSGKFLGLFLVGLLQFVILVLFGALVLGADWGSNLPGVFLVGTAFVLSAVGLGTLLAALVRTPQQATAFATFISIVLGMLGGSWWAVEILSPALQTVARFTPTYWAINGFNRLISFGESISAVLPNILILLGIAATALLLGTLLFRYE